ncbi:FAD-dependent oxidoreductase [Arthrobacter rhombi]|uniref:FAD-dependent oxidoreductase n=1 Tax=Arthrobacter rhombi TaxID=71253 RepID=UPI0031DFA92D
MEQLDVDTLVIGWGKGGKTLAGQLARSGRQVALVERSPQMYGGTCINVACVPTKALVHQASGRREGDDPVEWFSSSVAARDGLIGKLRAKNHEMLATVSTVTLIDGDARFIAPGENGQDSVAPGHLVEVTGGTETLHITAEHVIINTGAFPARPSLDGLAALEPADGVYDSTTIQHADPFPRRLTILGSGYVGLEFAGMFADFGSEVTVVGRSEALLSAEDDDVASAVREGLEAQGVTFRLGASATSVAAEGGTVTLGVTDSAGDGSLEADALLVATGRTPATAVLGLDAVGIATDDRGYIPVDDFLRTSLEGVYAVGDVNGGDQFTYISLDDSRILAGQLMGKGTRSRADRVAVPSTTFLTPPLARVGLNEKQAREAGRDVLVASKKVAEIAAMPRPKIMEQTRGVIKFVVDPETDLVLGATLNCIDAQELVNLVALAMRAGVTASELRDGIWTHPSTTESLNEVLAGLAPLE